MKIKEFIEKVNEHDGMQAKKVYKRIAIGTPNNMGIFSIPEDATNFIEIDTRATSNSLYWKKEDREYLSALIEEFLHTPVNERFPEKKYRLVVKRENPFCPKYVSNIITELNGIGFDLSIDEKEARIFSEKELNQIKEREPSLAPAIDAMKEPAEDKDDEAD